MTEILSSPVVSLTSKRALEEVTSNPFYKRQRSLAMDVDGIEEEEIPRRVKRTRGDVMREMRQPNSQDDIKQQFFPTRSHYEEVIRQKDNEISQLRHSNNSLTEENRILKKAVSIQEQKLKESTFHSEQLQVILSQAAAKISSLENANSSLRKALTGSNAPSFILPDIPPDVY